MLTTPAPTTTTTTTADAYGDVLAELVGIGMEVARLIQAETRVLADADRETDDLAPRAAAVASVAAAFDRASRAIRRTVHLARHLDGLGDPADARSAARRRIIRGVEDAIQRTSAGERAETLYGELRERLEAPELDEDLRAGQTAAALIADICRDLGIEAMPGTHPWKRRTPSDITALCRMAGAPPANANGGQSFRVGERGGWSGGGVRPRIARLE